MASGQILAERLPALAGNQFYLIKVIDNGDGTVSLRFLEQAGSDYLSNAANITNSGGSTLKAGSTSGGITGTLTPGFIPLADTASSLIDSLLSQTTGVVSNSGITGIADGTVAGPGLVFSLDTDTGIYRIGANNLGIAANGALVVSVAAASISLTGNLIFNADATYDIGASGATRPRNLFLSGAATFGTPLAPASGGTNNAFFAVTGPTTTTKTFTFPDANATVATGTGTNNKLAKFTTGASGIVGDSQLTDDGTNLTVAATQTFYPDGTALLPSVGFTNSTTRGLFNDTTNSGIGFTVNAIQVAFLSATTFQLQRDAASLDFIMLRASTDTGGSTWRIKKSRGTIAVPADVVNGDTIGAIQGQSYSGSFLGQAQISIVVDGTFTSGQRPPSRLSFFTNIANTSVTERWRISSTGDFLTVADNAYDIGASGATRPRTIYVGTSVITAALTVSGLTANAFIYSGTAGAITSSAAPTNGQLLIGSTGAAPVLAALTAGTGITITNGAGSISIAAAAGSVTSSGSPAVTQVAIFTSGTDITGSANFVHTTTTGQTNITTDNTSTARTIRFQSSNASQSFGFEMTNASAQYIARWAASRAANNFINGSASGDICLTSGGGSIRLGAASAAANDPTNSALTITTTNCNFWDTIVSGGTLRVTSSGTMAFVPLANVVPFTISSYSLTGSNASSLLDLSGTWNTSGTPTAIVLNIADTTSNAASKFIDLQKSSVTVLAIDKVGSIQGTQSKTLTETSATGFVDIAVASNASVGGRIEYTVEADDGTKFQIDAGTLAFAGINEAGTVASVVSVLGTDAQALSAATTLTVTFDTAAGTGKFTVRCTATSSLTQTTLKINYRVIVNKGTTTVTPL